MCPCGQARIDVWPEVQPLHSRLTVQRPVLRPAQPAPVVPVEQVGVPDQPGIQLQRSDKMLLKGVGQPLELGGSIAWYAEARYVILTGSESRDVVLHMPCMVSMWPIQALFYFLL